MKKNLLQLTEITTAAFFALSPSLACAASFTVTGNESVTESKVIDDDNQTGLINIDATLATTDAHSISITESVVGASITNLWNN